MKLILHGINKSWTVFFGNYKSRNYIIGTDISGNDKSGNDKSRNDKFGNLEIETYKLVLTMDWNAMLRGCRRYYNTSFEIFLKY